MGVGTWYGRRLVTLEGSVDELRDNTRAAQQDCYASAIERGPNRLVGVKFPNIGIIDHAWLLGTVGHWKIPCAVVASPEHQTDRCILGTPDRQSGSIFGTDADLSPLRLRPTLHPHPRLESAVGPRLGA
jgi:hypothetical protein